MEQKRISFVGDATTSEAFVYIFRYTIVIIRNTWLVIDKLVHRFPWVCMMVTIISAFVISLVFIGKARAERDSYNKQNVQLTEKVASYEALYGKEARQ